MTETLVLSDAQFALLTAPRMRPSDIVVIQSTPVHDGSAWRRFARPQPGFDEGAFVWLFENACHRLYAELAHRYRPGCAPPARRVRMLFDVDPIEQEFELDLEIYDGQRARPRIPLPRALDPRVLGQLGFERICELWWNGAAAAFNDNAFRRFDWRDDVELRNRVEDAYRGRRPAPATYDLGPPLFGDAYTTAVEMTATEAGLRERELGQQFAAQIDRELFRLVGGDQLLDMRLEPGAVNDVEGGPMAMMPYAAMHGLAVLDAPATVHVSPAMLEEMRRANEAHTAAVKRGEALLRAWLTPEQLAQYEHGSSFEVKGGATGRRYRVNRPGPYNIDLLNTVSGEVMERLCFMPEGGLVGGDIMLAQKLALETNEDASLKIANRRAAVYGFAFAPLRHVFLAGDWGT